MNNYNKIPQRKGIEIIYEPLLTWLELTRWSGNCSDQNRSKLIVLELVNSGTTTNDCRNIVIRLFDRIKHKL